MNCKLNINKEQNGYKQINNYTSGSIWKAKKNFLKKSFMYR